MLHLMLHSCEQMLNAPFWTENKEKRNSEKMIFVSTAQISQFHPTDTTLVVFLPISKRDGASYSIFQNFPFLLIFSPF